VVETRGFAPQRRRWFALSWFEWVVGSGMFELEQNVHVRQEFLQ
jgi:hypothetical protein